MSDKIFLCCVVKVHESKDRFIAPRSWVCRFNDSSDCIRTVVIYPKGDLNAIYELARKNEPTNPDWHHYEAKIEHNADSFAAAESWLKANNKVSYEQSYKREDTTNNDLSHVDEKVFATHSSSSRNRGENSLPLLSPRSPDNGHMSSSRKRPALSFFKDEKEERKRDGGSEEAFNAHQQTSALNTARKTGRNSRVRSFSRSSSDDDTTNYYQKNEKSISHRSDPTNDTNHSKCPHEFQDSKIKRYLAYTLNEGKSHSRANDRTKGLLTKSFRFSHYPVRGTASSGSTGLQASDKIVFYYYREMKLATSINDIRNHLTNICGRNVCTVAKVSKIDDNYSAFRIGVPSHLVDLVRASKNWERGVIFREWNDHLSINF